MSEPMKHGTLPRNATDIPAQAGTSIGPEDWRQAMIDALAPGSSLSLRPGQYQASLRIDQAIHLRSEDPGQPAVLVPGDSGSALVLGGTGAIVSNLVFQGTDRENQSLVVVESGDWRIENCVFSRAYAWGIRVAGHRAMPAIHACTLHGGSSGILVADGALPRLSGNEILDHFLDGVVVQDSGSQPVLESNRIHSNRHSGVLVRGGAGGEYRDNDIHHNLLSNVVVSDRDSNPRFDNNRIYEGRRGGVCVQKAAQGIFENNEIYENGVENVEVKDQDTNPRFIGNTIHHGKAGGVSINHGANGVFEQNTIHANTLANLFVYGNGTDPTVKSNTIFDGRYSGISVFGGAGGNFESNDIHGNDFANVMVFQSGTTPHFFQNRLHHGKQGGFFINNGAGGDYFENEVYDNAMANVEVIDPGTNPRLRKNRIHSCVNEGILIQNGASGLYEHNEIEATGLSTKGLKDAGPGYPSIRVKDPHTEPVFLHNKVKGFASAAFEVSHRAGGVYEHNQIRNQDESNHLSFDRVWQLRLGTNARRNNNSEQ